MSLKPEDQKQPQKAASNQQIEVSFESIRYCKRGHGILPKDYRCPECAKGGWPTSPITYLLYGIAAAVLSFIYIPFDSSLTKLPAAGIYIFIFFPQVTVAWGVVMAIIEHQFRSKDASSARLPVRSAYRRESDCPVCGERLGREGWCEACSRNRTMPLIQLLIVLLPMFGVSNCFAGYLLVANSPMAALFILVLSLPPVVAAVMRYGATLPQK